MDTKLKHLEFIQAVITRMAGNSFLLKGWSVTLAAALFALSAKETNPKLILLACYPIAVFWLLDGYFLSQERLFRALYDKVRKIPEAEIDFSMDTSAFNSGHNTWLAGFISKTLLIFYGAVLVVLNVVALYIVH